MTSLPSVASLSLREKIGQTCQINGCDLAGLGEDAVADYFRDRPVGGIFLGSDIIGSEGSVTDGLQALIARFQSLSRIRLTVAGDLENGAGGAIRGLTAFPNLLALGAMNDPAAAYEYGRWTALEACRVGFNWTLGPVVDLVLNWLNPVVSVRSLGQSPERVAELAVALIKGCQDHGLSATAKHFPGDGVDFREQHLCVSVNSLSEEQWWQTFGEVFAACFGAGVHAVMAGHIALPWLEKALATGRSPLPATTSRRLLGGLLRDRMNFDGVLISDALFMGGFRGRSARREDLIVEAFEAGMDVMLWPGPDYFELMERAVESGRISEERLDESVGRILAMKARQVLPPDNEISSAEFLPNGQHPAAIQFADRLAERSLTLVENRRGILPLNPEKTRRIQVLLATPREAGAENRLAPLLDGLRARGIECEVNINGNCLDLAKKEAAGERFDALVAVFELWIHGFKNTMRPTGPMAECMWTIQNVETMQPIIVSMGSPFLLHDMPWADTYINTYSANAHTLRAVEKALFGEIPFTGESPVGLTVSWDNPEGLQTQCLPEVGLALESTLS